MPWGLVLSVPCASVAGLPPCHEPLPLPGTLGPLVGLTVVCFPLSHTCQGQGNPTVWTLVLLT